MGSLLQRSLVLGCFISPYHTLGLPVNLNSRLLGYVTIEYVEPRTHYLGNWSPWDNDSTYIMNSDTTLSQAFESPVLDRGSQRSRLSSR